MRNNYNQESGADNNSLNFQNFGSSTNFPGAPSRGLSDPSLFKNTSYDLSSLMSSLNLNSKSSFTAPNKSSATALGLLSSGNPTSNSSNIPGITSPGLTFDPSDFPPIGNTVNPPQNQTFAAQNRNYVSVTSKNPNNLSSNSISCGNPNSLNQSSPEFSIERDFPELPKAHATNLAPPVSSSSQSLNMATGEAFLKQSQASQRLPRSQSTCVPQACEGGSDDSVLQFLEENVVANIPPDMIDNQFGMIGLLKLIHIDPFFDTWAPGLQIKQLGLGDCAIPGLPGLENILYFLTF